MSKKEIESDKLAKYSPFDFEGDVKLAIKTLKSIMKENKGHKNFRFAVQNLGTPEAPEIEIALVGDKKRERKVLEAVS